MMRTFEYPNRCSTNHIAPPLTWCWFDTAQLPSDSDKIHWVASHILLCISVASNVPGHDQVKCLVTSGDTNKLVADME